MKRYWVIVCVVGALLIAGCAEQQGSSMNGVSATKTAETSVGTVLTTPAGMTLYVFDTSSPYADACGKNGKKCAKKLKPYKVDGKQAMHNGAPLFTCKKDKKPGDTRCHKHSRVWLAARP